MGAERELVPPARSITTSKEQVEYARNIKNFQSKQIYFFQRTICHKLSLCHPYVFVGGGGMNEVVQMQDYKPDLLKTAISEAQNAVDKLGVELPNARGKKYLMVKDRLRIFRDHFPYASIKSTVIHANDLTICIQVDISLHDTQWASGVAQEKASKRAACEVAETSALGRALAQLGMYGDEFASLDEMVKVNQQPQQPSIKEEIKNNFDWQKFIDDARNFFKNCEDHQKLRHWMDQNESKLHELKKYSSAQYDDLGDRWSKRYKELGGVMRNV